ncbi:MAG: ThuA domain-containing protein [Bryobacteraceae bacterium]
MIRFNAFLLAALAGPLVAATPARILIVTGQSDIQYHNWRVTTAFLRQALENTGRFEVRTTEEPRGLTPEALAPYDAILLNYNGPRWGAAAEAALDGFVRNGKGLVSFHGVTYGPLMGTVLQPDGSWRIEPAWPAYSEMLGVSWARENIGHAVRHAFTVKLADDGGAITRGMQVQFTVNDELYHKMAHHPGIHVVASAFDDAARGGTGKQEPIAWTNAYGKGRTFHMTLGHDISALYQPEVLTLFARATEWAATGEVTLPPLISMEPVAKDAVRVLVVTGGHAYDPSFYDVFAGQNDIRWSHATSPAEAFAPGLKDRCDVIVLYDMHNELREPEQKVLREYVESGKGVVALHHSIVDYTSWPWWYEEVIGGKYFEKPVDGHPASHYKEGLPMVVKPARGMENHPIVRGLGELVTDDECYRGMWHSPRITVLMETANEMNDRPVVYLGPQPGGHAVYIQLGHGSFTHRHPGYHKLVHNAIFWAAGRAR